MVRTYTRNTKYSSITVEEGFAQLQGFFSNLSSRPVTKQNEDEPLTLITPNEKKIISEGVSLAARTPRETKPEPTSKKEKRQDDYSLFLRTVGMDCGGEMLILCIYAFRATHIGNMRPSWRLQLLTEIKGRQAEFICPFLDTLSPIFCYGMFPSRKQLAERAQLEKIRFHSSHLLNYFLQMYPEDQKVQSLCGVLQQSNSILEIPYTKFDMLNYRNLPRIAEIRVPLHPGLEVKIEVSFEFAFFFVRSMAAAGIIELLP